MMGYKKAKEEVKYYGAYHYKDEPRLTKGIKE